MTYSSRSNPVLDWFRSAWDDPLCGSRADLMRDFLADGGIVEFGAALDSLAISRGHIDHARKVIGKLAHVAEEAADQGDWRDHLYPVPEENFWDDRTTSHWGPN